MPAIRVPFSITARPADPPDGDVPVVALTVFDKTFVDGSFVGSSVVHMVSALGGDGPLVYVALERLHGSLDGRSGAFLLRHEGSIVEGVPSLMLEVVPGSGTDALARISGRGTIEHTDSGAFLVLDYLLPD